MLGLCSCYRKKPGNLSSPYTCCARLYQIGRCTFVRNSSIVSALSSHTCCAGRHTGRRLAAVSLRASCNCLPTSSSFLLMTYPHEFAVALGESASPGSASHSGENACLNHVFAGSEEAKVKRTTLPQILSTVANHPLVRISASGERCNLEIG
jgi:hypothetical protein